MTLFYSDPSREDDAYALPDCEVFYIEDGETYATTDSDGEPLASGWYYWFCLPGCMPDSDPIGPFTTEEEAIADAREGCE